MISVKQVFFFLFFLLAMLRVGFRYCFPLLDVPTVRAGVHRQNLPLAPPTFLSPQEPEGLFLPQLSETAA